MNAAWEKAGISRATGARSVTVARAPKRGAGAKLGSGGDRSQTASVAVCSPGDVAKELGVAERTARHRMALADDYAALPASEKKKIDAGEETIAGSTRARRLAEARARVNKQREQDALRATLRAVSCEKLLSSLKPESIDLLLTDPPYMTDVEDIGTFAKWVRLGGNEGG